MTPPVTVGAVCGRCTWAIEVTGDDPVKIAEALSHLIAEHTATAHPGTLVVVVDARPQAES